jgi:hypothetical protein
LYAAENMMVDLVAQFGGEAEERRVSLVLFRAVGCTVSHFARINGESGLRLDRIGFDNVK